MRNWWMHFFDILTWLWFAKICFIQVIKGSATHQKLKVILILKILTFIAKWKLKPREYQCSISRMSPSELAESSILFHTFPSISSRDAIRCIQAIWERPALSLLQLITPQSTHLPTELCLSTIWSATALLKWCYWRKDWQIKGTTFLLSADYKLHWDVVTDGRTPAAAWGSVPFHLPVSALPLSR